MNSILLDNLYQSIYLNNSFEKSEKQAGYSKSKDCDFLALILVASTTGDGEFTGYHIKSTYLMIKDDKTLDVNNNEDFFEELTIFHETVYHPLPDGKYIEYQIKDNYTNELNNISSEILKIRQYHVLDKTLLKNKEKSSIKKFKI